MPTPRGSDIFGSTSSCSTTRTVFATQNASHTENRNSSTPPRRDRDLAEAELVREHAGHDGADRAEDAELVQHHDDPGHQRGQPQQAREALQQRPGVLGDDAEARERPAREQQPQHRRQHGHAAHTAPGRRSRSRGSPTVSISASETLPTTLATAETSNAAMPAQPAKRTSLRPKVGCAAPARGRRRQRIQPSSAAVSSVRPSRYSR